MRILHATEVCRGGVITAMDSLIAGQLSTEAVTAVYRVCSAPWTQPESTKLAAIQYARDGRDIASQVRLAINLAICIWKMSPDVVHLHSSFAGFWGRLICALLRFRRAPAVIYTPHAFAFMTQSKFDWLYALAERLLIRLCDCVICVSKDELEQASVYGLPKSKLHLIYNGVQSQPASAKSLAPNLKVLFVGRFDKQKGFDIFVEALSLLAGRCDFEARAIGASDRERGCESEHRSPHVEYLGWCSMATISEQYKWADVVVVPSRWEGFAMVPLEAMSHGCAVIASNCSSLPEAVSSGVTGLLFATGDSHSLAAAICSRTAAEFREMGVAGRLKQRTLFLFDHVVEQTHNLYARCRLPRNSSLYPQRNN